AAASLPTDYTTISRDVVVIGGGSSGTYAAVNLLARGQSVAVLEQQGRLGGHVETYHDPATGTPFNLGVILYYNNTFNNAYFSLLGVPTAPVSLGAAASDVFLDLTTGKTMPGFDVLAQVDSFLPAMMAYTAYVNATYPYLTLSYENLTYPVPDELLEPFTVFAARHNFTSMLQFYENIAQNIGNLWQLPTYRAIHAFDPKLIEALDKGFINAASGNNQDIYSAAAAYLGVQNVFLSSTVLDVDRSGRCFGLAEERKGDASGVCVLFTSSALSGNETTLIKARKLLVAIPPSLASLASAHMDLDAHERAVFSKLHGITYGVTVFAHPGLNTSVYTNIGTHTPDNLLSLPGAFMYAPLPEGRFSATFGALEESGWTDADVEALIHGEIDRLIAHGNAAGDPANVTFDFLKIHAPFRLAAVPHDVVNGFY
ncbi:hypothetical protein C8R44DRAFT_800412, partial [Mycena epipterygia]